MTNDELNNLALTQEDRDYINKRFDFIINQFQGVQKSFNSGDTHFADTVCALPNLEHFYKRMSEFLELWYDVKKQEKDKNYIRLNNYWLKKGSTVYIIDYNNLGIKPQIVELDSNLINSSFKYFPTYKAANDYRINEQVYNLTQQIEELNKQR